MSNNKLRAIGMFFLCIAAVMICNDIIGVFKDKPPEPQYERHVDREAATFMLCLEAAPKWSQDGGEVINQCRAYAHDITRTREEGE